MRFAVLLVASLLAPCAALADGALAVGQNGPVEKNGISIGFAVRFESAAAAEAEALNKCRTFVDAPARVKQECRLIATFKDEWVAIALDPEAGTPGVGWAIAASKADAEQRALAACRSTAGKRRMQFCVITNTDFDGAAADSK